jgi:preflagellin peptidase FlaK
VTVTLAFLLYASWSDYKTREVSNRVWAVYAPIAVALSLAEILLYDLSKLAFFGLSFGLTAAFALLLFYAGGFGGADSKALMCIALALPFFPEPLLTPVVPSGISPISQILFPVTILSNSVLIAAASGLYLLVVNLVRRASTGKALFEGTLAQESLGRKLVALITGQKVAINKLKAKWHVYPMEDIEEENGENPPKRKLVIIPRNESRDEIVARLSRAAERGKIDPNVWATPGLPMLIFMTIGLIVALVFGDIIWIVISRLLG